MIVDSLFIAELSLTSDPIRLFRIQSIRESFSTIDEKVATDLMSDRVFGFELNMVSIASSNSISILSTEDVDKSVADEEVDEF